MADTAKAHHDCTSKFIELANNLTKEGLSKELVSAAMMSASGVFATYVVAGNDGGLNDSGVEKVVEAFEHHLKDVQAAKKKQMAAKKDGKGEG